MHLKQFVHAFDMRVWDYSRLSNDRSDCKVEETVINMTNKAPWVSYLWIPVDG